jgi:hypothetical protein
VLTIPPTHLYQDVDVIGMYLQGLHINQESNTVMLIDSNQFDSLRGLPMDLAPVNQKVKSGRKMKRSFHQLLKKKKITDRAKNPRSTSHCHVMKKKRNRPSKRAQRNKLLNDVLMREFGLRLPAAVASSLRTNTQMHSQSIASEEIQNHVNSRKRCYPYNKFFVTGRSTNNSEPSQSKKMKPSTRICRPPTFVTTRKSFHYRIISRAVFRGRILLASSPSIIKNH